MGLDAFYVRRPGEYVRPLHRLRLGEEFPDPDDHYIRFLRGAKYQEPLFAGHQPGQRIELELVPERHNPHDVHAVAVDHDGNRVGYLPAGEAARWHDIILAANRQGFSLWVSGELENFDFDEGGRRLVPRILIPKTHLLCDIGRRFRVANTVAQLLDAVGPQVRTQLLDHAWQERLPASLVRQVTAQAGTFPQLTWPSNPPDGVGPQQVPPGVLFPYLKQTVLNERREAAERRRIEAAERRAARTAEAERLRAESARLNEEAREARLEQVRKAVAQGLTNAQICAEFTIGRATLAKLKQDLRGGAGWDHNAEVREDRLGRAQEAVRLQQQGLTRAAIGERMSLGAETVETLLRDGKFYADPGGDPERLQRANAAAEAVREGLTRAQFRARGQLSKPKSVEAWKDADVLGL